MTRSRNLTIGLMIAAFLGAVDVVSGVGAGADPGPPLPVLILGVVMGIITLVGVSLAWRGRRGGVPTVGVSRVISALSGVPVFFIGDDAPDWAPPAVAAGIVLTVVALVLLHVGRRKAAVTG